MIEVVLAGAAATTLLVGLVLVGRDLVGIPQAPPVLADLARVLGMLHDGARAHGRRHRVRLRTGFVEQASTVDITFEPGADLTTARMGVDVTVPLPIALPPGDDVAAGLPPGRSRDALGRHVERLTRSRRAGSLCQEAGLTRSRQALTWRSEVRGLHALRDAVTNTRAVADAVVAGATAGMRDLARSHRLAITAPGVDVPGLILPRAVTAFSGDMSMLSDAHVEVVMAVLGDGGAVRDGEICVVLPPAPTRERLDAALSDALALARLIDDP